MDGCGCANPSRAQREIIPKNTVQPKVSRSRIATMTLSESLTNISGYEISMRQDYLLIDEGGDI